MAETPFAFVWSVDQRGYEIFRNRIDPESAKLLGKDEFEFVVPRGGPTRLYHPLDDDSLWLRFAQSCTDAESVIAFANEFGALVPNVPEYLDNNGDSNRLDHILEIAEKLKIIWEHLKTEDRYSAMRVFDKGMLPTMKEGILWYQNEPERFHIRLFPLTLRDALLHQAGEAIAGNRTFRRCRNEGCLKWFRLGTHTAGEGGRRRTITARREFCSDRCRVASARRLKREGAVHA